MSDIAELFARDPLSLTTEDLDTIILHYRKAREANLLGDKKAGKTPEKKPKALDLNQLGINLDDIGI